MVPLPEHEKAKEIIGDMVKFLLSERGINYESLGSTTLKNQRMTQAVEPDTCFYIQNQVAIIGKNRLDMSQYGLLNIVRREERSNRRAYFSSCFTPRRVLSKPYWDMSIDPPPDLAIEIDLTSRTQLDNYQILGVPELWRYARRGLQINVLQGDNM